MVQLFTGSMDFSASWGPNLVDLKHPMNVALIAALAAAVLGAGGFLVQRYLFDVDRGELRLEIQGVRQVIDLLAATQPTLDGETVYCDTLGLTLVLAHSRDGTRPILVHDLRLEVEPEPIDGTARDALDCEVDVLATRPYGINEVRTYVFTLTDDEHSGRFLESRQEANTVKPGAILGSGANETVITLAEGEPPIAMNMFVETQSTQPLRIHFYAAYDAGGEKETETQSLLITRAPITE